MTQVTKTDYLPPERGLQAASATSAAELTVLKQNIRLFADGVRRAGAELYGYAFLAGRAMLQAKDLIPHGNKEPGAGFQNWIEEHYPDISYRTCAAWMRFTEAVQEKSADAALFKAEPKLLHNGKLSEKDCEAVLNVVPQLMDGKSMTSFMRDSRLAKEPTPAGGYRPDLKALRKWLEAQYPSFVGTPWADLPEPMRKQFQKEHKPKIDPKLVAESKRQKADAVLSDLGVMLTEQEFKKYWTPEQCLRAKDLFWDFHQKLVDLHHKAPKQPKRKATK